MDLIRIGQYIAGKRKVLGLTQKQLAEKLGVSDKSVSKWERGVCLPDVSLYTELCAALGIGINEFLSGDDIAENDLPRRAEENILQTAADGKRRQKRLKCMVAVLLIVSAVLSSVYSNEESSGPVHSVQAGVGMVAAPLQFVGVGVAYAEDAAGDAIQNATASDSSYTQLRDENAQLKAQLAELQEYRGEAQRLQGLLDLSDKYDFSGVTGRVIGKGTDAWNRVVTLNVGSASGVECGLPVVGGSGLVGQVIEVSPLTCRVRLISDPQSGVSVVLQSNRAEGVVRGSIAGLLYLEDLDTSTEVNVGDVVITSGLGGSYFRGVALGTVVNVINAAGTSDRTIVVEPFSSADPLEELTVVLRMGSEGDLSGTSDASSSDSGSSEGGA